jgi:hypothetical protein
MQWTTETIKFSWDFIIVIDLYLEELDGPVISALRRAIEKDKQHWSVIGWVTKNLLTRARPCFGSTLSRWSRQYLQSLAPTNRHWARVVGCGPFSLCVIHKERRPPAVRRLIGWWWWDLYFYISIKSVLPLTLYPRRRSRGISDIPLRLPRFTKIS